LTSDTEGLPGVVPEAGFFEVPAVASNVGGISECIKDGVSGFIVEKDQIDDFIEKTIYLLQNICIRNAMGLSAREIALKDFDISNISKQYSDFFNYLKNDIQ